MVKMQPNIVHEDFDFYIESLNSKNQFLIDTFNSGYDNFNKYLSQMSDRAVIHLIIKSNPTELIGYFSLSASAILFPNDEKLSAVPSIEMKMFCLGKEYQGCGLGHVVYDRVQLKIQEYALECVGADIILLYALPAPKVINFYEQNGFCQLPISAHFYTSYFNEGCIPMWKIID